MSDEPQRIIDDIDVLIDRQIEDGKQRGDGPEDEPRAITAQERAAMTDAVDSAASAIREASASQSPAEAFNGITVAFEALFGASRRHRPTPPHDDSSSTP